MEKFKLTRDQLYHYAKYHNIPKVKKGKYTLISKPELDKLLAAPKNRISYLSVNVATITSPYFFAPNKCKTLNIKQYDTRVQK